MKDIFTSIGDEDEDFLEPKKENKYKSDEAKGTFAEHGFKVTLPDDDLFDDSGFFDETDERYHCGKVAPTEPEVLAGRDAVRQVVVNEYDIPDESTDSEFVKPKKIKKPKNDNPKKKKGFKKAVIKVLICLLLILVVGAVGVIYSICSKANYQPDSHTENQYISESELYCDKNVFNILIIGTDKRETQANYRSDTMILASVDKNSKAIKLTSFLRDSYVYIPAKSFSTKLNAACAYGGPQMVIDTIEYNFGIHIDKYVMIDFDIFKTIISDLGGITLTMTEEEAACIRKESGLTCKAGTHTYNAKRALWYARIRHLDSDFKRTERQRKVIQAVIDKMKKTDPVTLYNMLNEVVPMVETDMNAGDMFSVGLKVLPLLSKDIQQMQIPVKGTWGNATKNGQAVLVLDFDENKKQLKDFIYGEVK